MPFTPDTTGPKAALALDRHLRARAEHRSAHLASPWVGQHGAMTASGIIQVVADRAASVGLPGLHPTSSATPSPARGWTPAAPRAT